MPRKKSGRKAACVFRSKLDRIEAFVSEVAASPLSDQACTWAYEAAIIKTSVAFEHLMLDCIVTAINNDTETIAHTTGVAFPKHLTDEVCYYLVTGGGFFDFRGRDGLIKKFKDFVADEHWLVQVVKKPKYKTPLNRLFALRNFAAHESRVGKRALLATVDQTRVSSAGTWLKTQGRFEKLLSDLHNLADDIETSWPY